MIFRKMKTVKLLFSGGLFAFFNKGENISPTYRKLKEEMDSSLTGWDRLRDLFRRDEFEDLHPSMQAVISLTLTSGFVGYLLGGALAYKKAAMQFLSTNDATKFLNATEAKKKLAAACLTSFTGRALLVAPKAAFYTGIFLLTHTCTSVYRGKNGILEYPVATALTFSIYRWNLGVRGIFYGFVSGGIIGFVVGLSVFLSSKLFGLTMSDVRYVTYMTKKGREDSLRSRMEKVKLQDASTYEVAHYLRTRDLPIGLEPLKDSSDTAKESKIDSVKNK